LKKLITGIALDARVNKGAPKSSPMQPSDEVYAAGARNPISTLETLSR
jgi:hypothetical protein